MNPESFHIRTGRGSAAPAVIAAIPAQVAATPKSGQPTHAAQPVPASRSAVQPTPKSISATGPLRLSGMPETLYSQWLHDAAAAITARPAHAHTGLGRTRSDAAAMHPRAWAGRARVPARAGAVFEAAE